MGWIRIEELRKPNIRDITLVQGLPGLGLVGKLAVDYIIEELRPERFAILYSNDLMLPDGKAGVLVDIKGLCELPRYEFYSYKGPKGDIVFLTGNTQPVSWAQYEVAEKVLNYLKEEYGLKLVIAVCGTVARGRSGEVYVSANDEELLREVASKYSLKVSSEGAVTGACGIVPGLAKLHGIKGLILMGGVGQIYPDPVATRSVLRVLNALLGLNVSLARMDLIVEDMVKKSMAIERLRRSMATREGGEREERGPPWYYV
ncbi:MAG: hypothetical protein B6U69_04030 [Thermofilum sp. ex4484_15]|nr:MAG: hypothetical protein B6U69_04030 [Thermofilum sp. ex4484_15]